MNHSAIFLQHVVDYYTVQYIGYVAVYYKAINRVIMLCITVQHNALQCNVMHYITMLCSALLGIMQCIRVQCCAQYMMGYHAVH